MAFRRSYGIGAPKKLPKAVVGRGGGVGAPGPAPAPYITPPPLSFDPSIEAERRASVRGYEDTAADVATKEHFAQNNLAHALAHLKQESIRDKQNVARTAERSRRSLSYQQQDVETKNQRAGQDLSTRQQRGNEDFAASLANIGRQFAQLGHRQGEAANAAGVLDTGTQAASAAARGQNQLLAEAPIHTAQGRLNQDIATSQGRLGEDLATALGRIATSGSEISQDEQRTLTRNAQDITRERKEAEREKGRKFFEAQREKERAKREEEIYQVDALAKEIYASREEHPAIFRQWAQEHPEAIAKAKGEAEAHKATGGHPHSGIGGGGRAPAPTGGTAPPNKKRRRH